MPDPQDPFRDALLRMLAGAQAPHEPPLPAPVASHPATDAVLMESLRTRATPNIPTSGPMGRTRIGPETNPETRLELMRDPVVPYQAKDLDPNALMKLSNEYMNQRLRSPTAIFDAPGLVSVFGSDKVARQVATNKMLVQLAETIRDMEIPQEVGERMQAIAKKYPRVLAHVTDMGPDNHVDEALGTYASKYETPALYQPGRGEIAFNPNRPNSAARTFAHELTHAAQHIGLKEKFDPAYNQASEALQRIGGRSDKAYQWNPFEISARAAAEKRMKPGAAPADLWDTPNEHPLRKMLLDMGVDLNNLTRKPATSGPQFSLDDVAARMGKPAGAFTTIVEQRPSGEYTVAIKDRFGKEVQGKHHARTAGWMDLGSDVVDDHLTVDNVFVEPEYRGKGLGGELYQEAIKAARKRWYTGLASNPSSRNSMSDQIWKDRPGVTQAKDLDYDLMSEYISRRKPEPVRPTLPDDPIEAGEWLRRALANSNKKLEEMKTRQAGAARQAPGQPHPLVQLLIEQMKNK